MADLITPIHNVREMLTNKAAQIVSAKYSNPQFYAIRKSRT